jgi:hypothetical protein
MAGEGGIIYNINENSEHLKEYVIAPVKVPLNLRVQ